MRNLKLNILTLIGALLCLVSMLFAYISISAIVIRLPIGWHICARYINYLYYAVPVIGLIILASAFVDAPALKLVGVGLAVIFSIYYLITHRSVQGGDFIRYLTAASPLLKSSIGIDASDVTGALEIIRPLMSVGLGGFLFMGGTVVSGIGMLVQGTVGGAGSYSGSSKHNSTSYSGGSQPRHRY